MQLGRRAALVVLAGSGCTTIRAISPVELRRLDGFPGTRGLVELRSGAGEIVTFDRASQLELQDISKHHCRGRFERVQITADGNFVGHFRSAPASAPYTTAQPDLKLALADIRAASVSRFSPGKAVAMVAGTLALIGGVVAYLIARDIGAQLSARDFP